MDTPACVLILIDELEHRRGTETHLLRLLPRLDPARLRPVVAVVGRAGLAGVFRDAGVAVVPLKIFRVLAPSGLRGLARICRLARRERAGLMISYHTASDLLAPLAAQLAGIPNISSRRDMGFTKKPVHVRIQRQLNRLVQGMISVSAAVAQEVQRAEGYPLSRNLVIHNGEDLQRFCPGPSPLRRRLDLDPADCVLICVGALAPVKDLPTLLAAFEQLHRGEPQTRLLLVGEGTQREALQQQARPLGQAVRFLGHRDDVPELLRAADIYVQTSTTEGFSNAIVQAMATALPVVATRVGGNPELLPEQCLVHTGAAGAMARRLLPLVQDAQLRRELGRQLRDRAEQQCSIEAMTAAYSEAFERAIRRP